MQTCGGQTTPRTPNANARERTPCPTHGSDPRSHRPRPHRSPEPGSNQLAERTSPRTERSLLTPHPIARQPPFGPIRAFTRDPALFDQNLSGQTWMRTRPAPARLIDPSSAKSMAMAYVAHHRPPGLCRSRGAVGKTVGFRRGNWAVSLVSTLAGERSRRDECGGSR